MRKNPVAGCMAERLKEQILERDKMVDLVCGPDAYRDLPRMLAITEAGNTAGRPASQIVANTFFR